MNRIHLLEDDVINKIAAGEVVVRPANVVKELVENAIDAGSDEITIDLGEGGIKSIVVKDNGHGIAKEDLPLAVTRHATSKISRAEDLYQISSMGFRGEALASIGSVSRFSISSRKSGASSGYSLAREDNQERILPWNGPEGTTVKCNDIFYNIPARAKFLKSSTTEFAHINELVQAISLANPSVTLKVIHNDKEKFVSYKTAPENDSSFKGEEALRKRFEAILDRQTVSELIYIRDESQYSKFEGLISPPGLEKPTGKSIYTFANERWVKDQTLRYGILRGYHSHLLKGRFPIALLFVYTDPSLIDVNVHPAKTEVKFQYPTEIQGQIALTIRKALREGDWASASQEPAAKQAGFDLSQSQSFRAQSTPSFSQPVSRPAAPSSHSFTTRSQAPSFKDTQPTEGGFSAEPPMSSQEEIIPWSELNYVGAFAKCYLFFEVEDRLLALDQHAFHERILYERLVKDKSLLRKTQEMLIPEAVTLGLTEVAYLESNQEKMLELGFKFEKSSDDTIEVSQVPNLLSGKDIPGVIAQLADGGLDESSQTSDLSFLHLATIACHSAVRAGEELGNNELKVLLSEANDVDFYHNCPHGRRVFKWFKKGEVERWFDR